MIFIRVGLCPFRIDVRGSPSHSRIAHVPFIVIFTALMLTPSTGGKQNESVIICRENIAIGTTVHNFAGLLRTPKWRYRLLKIHPTVKTSVINKQPTVETHSGQLARMFRLRSSGRLVVNAPIDREQLCPQLCSCSNCTFSLEIMAEPLDTGDIQLIRRMIRIEDENDNLPRFNQSSYTLKLSELHDVSNPICLPCAYDPDSADNGIHSVKLYTKQEDAPFALIGNNSSRPKNCPCLRVLRSLDAEREMSYELKVCVIEQRDQGRGACCVVHVQIEDENDNAPVFPNSVYSFSIAENDGFGSGGPRPIGSVKAIDADRMDADKISYRLVESEASDWFTIDASSGLLSTRENVTFDRELIDKYQIGVEAADSSDKKAQCQVIVHITDRNDNAPRFRVTFPGSVQVISHRNDNHSTIRVRENLRVGSQLALVQLSDEDGGENGKVGVRLYASWSNQSIVGSDVDEQLPFKLSHISDEDPSVFLVLTRGLDCEAVNSYQLRLVAKDNSPTEGQLSATYMIDVMVADVNDNDPVFSLSRYQFSVAENVELNRVIGEVKALDADVTAKPVIYQIRDKEVIKGKNDCAFFTIDERTGLIRTRQRLDREQQSQYHFECVASDQDGRLAVAEIQIYIIDVNDNAPVFDKNEYVLAVQENTRYTRPLYTFHSHDKDFEPRTSYAIARNTLVSRLNFTDAEFVRNHFRLNASTGDLELTHELDREIADKIRFVIEATDMDNNSLSAFAAVQINVIDQNDNEPKIHYPSHQAIICSSDLNVSLHRNPSLARGHKRTHQMASETAIYRLAVNATDLDRGINGDTDLIYHAEEARTIRKTTLHGSCEIKLIGNVMEIRIDSGSIATDGTSALSIMLKVCDRGRPKFFCAISTFTLMFVDKPLGPQQIGSKGTTERCEHAKRLYVVSLDRRRTRNMQITVFLTCTILVLAIVVTAYCGYRCSKRVGKGKSTLWQCALLKSRAGVQKKAKSIYERPKIVKRGTKGHCTVLLRDARNQEIQPLCQKGLPLHCSLTTDV